MPQKKNPISFENIKSLWKVVLPRLQTLYLDQISEHQRDLTNSASSRTYGEIINYVVCMIKRLTEAMTHLVVHHEQMEKNLRIQGDLVLAEPTYIILASLGHPNAHEVVRALAQKAIEEKTTLSKLVMEDVSLKKYNDKMTEAQKGVLSDPKHYIGLSNKKAVDVANKWRANLEMFKTIDLKPARDS